MSYPVAIITKDPDATKSYDLDWSDELIPDDYIVGSVWTVPSPLTTPYADSFEPDYTTVWIGGGVAGARYTLVNRITTQAGEIDDRTVLVEIVEL